MAVVLVEEPGAVVFSRNPVLYRFQSNARYSNPGRVYIGRITVNTLGSVGQEMKLTFSGRELVFKLANVPDDSGLQLPTPAVGESIADWTARLRVALAENYYINRYYTITSTASNNIVLTSRERHADFNIAFEHASGVFAMSVLQSAVTRTLQPNFKILAELFVKDQSGEFQRFISSSLEADDDGIAYWDISKQLTSALLIDGRDRPDMAVPYWEKSTRTIREFYVRYAEMYGTSQRVMKTKQSATRVGVLGGFSKAMMAERLFPDYFVTGALSKWMTTQGVLREIKPEQPAYMSIVNFVVNYTNVRARVKLYYSDHTEAEIELQNIGAWTKYSKLICPIGVQQNSLHLIDEAKVLTEYKIWLVNGSTVISEELHIRLNYKYEPYLRFLLYENAYGCYETFYTYGRKSNGYEVVQKNAKLINNRPFNLEDGEQVIYDVNLTDEEVLNTGYGTRAQIRAFRDFFLSAEKFAYKLGRYYPVMLASNTIKEFEDGNHMYALEFSLASTYNEELWTDEGEEEKYAYAPDLSGYIPAPPAVPENFDDRYYLKTETYNRAEIDNRINTLQTYVDGEVANVLDELADVVIQLANKASIDHEHPQYALLSDLAEMSGILFVGEWFEPSPEDDGYEVGLYVLHNNKMYQSQVENNTSEPGTNTDWLLVLSGGETTILSVEPGTNIYSLIWTEELKNKHGPVPREPTVLVKAGSDPPDTWTLLRSTVKYVLDGDGELSQMNVTISNLQAKIIIQ